jgi:hypothetical protein
MVAEERGDRLLGPVGEGLSPFNSSDTRIATTKLTPVARTSRRLIGSS